LLNQLQYDLHCHSYFSDGSLSPTELVTRAALKGVTHLALTDHDTIAGVTEAQLAAQQCGIEVITGVEFSCWWDGFEIHVVGLAFDPANAALQQRLTQQQVARRARVTDMLARLAKAGMDVTAQVTQVDERMPTRKHIADALVAAGHIKQFGDAFQRFIGKGQFAYVRPDWCSLAAAIDAIHGAGGVAVLAHPHAYQLTNKWLRRLLVDAKAVGLDGLEVAIGQQTHGQRDALAEFANDYELAASVGSDFHQPGRWRELGQNLCLPDKTMPIWQHWKQVAQ